MMAEIEKQIQSILQSPEAISDLVTKSVDWAMSHGFMMRTKDKPTDATLAEHAPFTLFPSPVPAPLYYQATAVQSLFNLLYHKVSLDTDFLRHCLRESIKSDDFIGGLWRVLEAVEKEGRVQPLSLELSRSDYMVDVGGEKAPSLKQIEYNCIASGMPALSDRVHGLHKYVFGEVGIDVTDEELARTTSLREMSLGMIEAWKAYGNPKAVIVFVVEEVPRNIYDQRGMEFDVRRACPQARTVRRKLDEIVKLGRLADDRTLFIGEDEVAVLYFRTGYSPDHYTQEIWAARLMLERSRAICCPTVAYQLAGCKKVQQELCKAGAVEKFLSAAEATQVRACFAMQYSLANDEEGEAAVRLGLQHPEDYVVKPQREGGGNNFFGKDIVAVLQDKASRSAYVLMERIRPPPHPSVLVFPGVPVTLAQTVTELGIFGVFLGDRTKTLANIASGFAQRCKLLGVNEGGLMTCTAGLDTPLLV